MIVDADELSTLLHAIGRGSRLAFDKPMEPHSPRLKGWARGRMGGRVGPYTPSDVVQDVYEEAWGALLSGRFTGQNVSAC